MDPFTAVLVAIFAAADPVASLLPPVTLDDGIRFGITHDAAVACRDFNRAYHAHLLTCQPPETTRDVQDHPASARGAAWLAAVADNDRRYEVWRLLAVSLGDEYAASWRRECLCDLRRLLGREAYGCGVMPQHVDTGGFREIR